MFNQFEKLLVALLKADVHFITVGGIACVLNGYVRVTDDLDILIEAAPENVDRLLRCLSEYGQGYAKELVVADFADEEGAIRIIEDFPIDVFTRMGGWYYRDLLKYVHYFEIEGSQVPFLNKDGLILLKQDSLRAKDKMDVQQLKSLQ